jgi:hypothetical protein
MDPLLQFCLTQTGWPQLDPGWRISTNPTPASGLPERTRRLLSDLLATERDGAVPDEQTCSELDLLAHRCVSARRAGAAPSSAAIHAYMGALANNFPLRATLLDAAAALSRAGVRAIVYKGQDYVERIYGDLGARAMADIDLLVPESELGRAERALLDAGFLADRDCRLMHERKFCKNGVAVDLHHALLQPARMAVDHGELFARALPCRFAPGLLVLEATDAFLVHCINQTVKAYQLPPSSYLELQALLAQADADAALERARAYRAQCALYSSLRALGDLGHAPARALAARVNLSLGRQRALDTLVVAFALRSIACEPPSRATLLALKTTLIDVPAAAARFIPQWCASQFPWKPPRALLAPAPAQPHRASS